MTASVWRAFLLVTTGLATVLALVERPFLLVTTGLGRGLTSALLPLLGTTGLPTGLAAALRPLLGKTGLGLGRTWRVFRPPVFLVSGLVVDTVGDWAGVLVGGDGVAGNSVFTPDTLAYPWFGDRRSKKFVYLFK